MFFIAFGYCSSRLSYINFVTSITFELINSTWVTVDLFVSYLLSCGGGRLKCDVQFRMFE